MTEAEWLNSCNLDLMFKLVRPQASSRRLRLYAVACCRFIWSFMPNEECRQSIRVAERFADGLATESELKVAAQTAQQFDGSSTLSRWSEHSEARAAAAACFYQTIGSDDPTNGAIGAAWSAGDDSIWAAARRGEKTKTQSSIADRFRDIFGNPFRPVAFSPSWRTDTAVTLARQMYDARDFSTMPILADALQDAGCDNDDILTHCRNPGEHVRGCWVVDLVLGKE